MEIYVRKRNERETTTFDLLSFLYTLRILWRIPKKGMKGKDKAWNTNTGLDGLGA